MATTHLSSLSSDSAQRPSCCTPLHIISPINSTPLEFLPSLLFHPLVASTRRQTTAKAGRRAWVEALTVGYVAAGALLLVVPSLRGDDGVDGTTVSLLLAQNLKRQKEKEEEEKRKWLERREVLLAVPFGRRSLAQVSRLHAVAGALDDVWEAPSSQPTKRKRKKRRKKKLPRTSSLRSSCAVSGFSWETASRLSFCSVLGSTVDACGFRTSFTHSQRDGAARDSEHFFCVPLVCGSQFPVVLRQLLEAFGRISLTSYVLFLRTDRCSYSFVLHEASPCDCRWFRHRWWYRPLEGLRTGACRWFGTVRDTDYRRVKNP